MYDPLRTSAAYGEPPILVRGYCSDDAVNRTVQALPWRGKVVLKTSKPPCQIVIKENLDDYLAGWLRSFQDNLSSPRKRLYCPIDGIIGTVTTDKDGRFTIRGAGAERIVHLVFEGKGVARST